MADTAVLTVASAPTPKGATLTLTEEPTVTEPPAVSVAEFVYAQPSDWSAVWLEQLNSRSLTCFLCAGFQSYLPSS
ncbi:hypothetical protein C6N75_04555 [Streptomyces solincola]|uniref:Uncharacterized protein n=1 Tax=Streptomyces solincola TaxID=2100817 RepID=A0A2S9Q109_9ACTN|nr:hypothetical protein C6N75_04555 [Streptomyces solincola]